MVARQADGQVFMNVTTPGGGFGAQMVGCDETFATCRAVALYSAFSRKGVNMIQINDYNRSQLTCRGIMTPSGEPSVMYAVVLNGRMTREELREHVGVWQGCLTGFGEFIQDPHRLPLATAGLSPDFRPGSPPETQGQRASLHRSDT